MWRRPVTLGGGRRTVKLLAVPEPGGTWKRFSLSQKFAHFSSMAEGS